MKLYHVIVERENNWYVGRVLERPGVTTQGRSLDELVEMLRDAIEAMWGEKNVQLELVLPNKTAERRGGRTSRRRASA
jgi:predicted RNase H-like HicB family nuclease